LPAAPHINGGAPLEERPLETAGLSQVDAAEKRKRGIRRTALVFGLVALFFYFGFIVLTLVRGSK
jgi:hypothetical protein